MLIKSRNKKLRLETYRAMTNVRFYVILLGLLTTATSFAGAYEYEIVDLGSMGGSWNQAEGISNSRQVVGEATTTSGERHAFLWTADSGMQDLGSLGGLYAKATGINELGQVVGSSWTTSGEQHACLWIPPYSTIRDLGTLPGGTRSEAWGINDLGQIVGWVHTASGELHACMWVSPFSTIRDLGMLPGGIDSRAWGINDATQVVGDSGGRAFLWTEADGMRDLGSLPGGTESHAYGINDEGQVVGECGRAFQSGGRAFLWTETDGMQELGDLPDRAGSAAWGINEAGQISGWAYLATGEYHAVIWTPCGNIQDLGTLPGGTLSWANGINDHGEIAGISNTPSGDWHACIWIPTTTYTPVHIDTLTAEPLVVPLGIAVNFEATITDGCGDFDALWDFDDGHIDSQSDVTSPGTITATHTYASTGEYTVVLSVTDNSNTVGESIVVVVYDPIEIVDGSLTANPLTVELGNSVTLEADITGGYDQVDALWDFDDGDIYSQSNVDSPGSVVATHTYNSVGVYTIVLSVTDTFESVVDGIVVAVYDPTGGFVTGGGWIDSPPGAYVPDPMLEGRANFGFVSRYKKGATAPTGQTEFVFKAGDLNFHSSSYEWLVVTGSDYARFKGSGTINGLTGGEYGEYRFMLWAGDNPDTFSIRIWEEDELSGEEWDVYDNGMDQPIEGGSIMVHTN